MLLRLGAGPSHLSMLDGSLDDFHIGIGEYHDRAALSDMLLATKEKHVTRANKLIMLTCSRGVARVGAASASPRVPPISAINTIPVADLARSQGLESPPATTVPKAVEQQEAGHAHAKCIIQNGSGHCPTEACMPERKARPAYVDRGAAAGEAQGGDARGGPAWGSFAA